MSTERSSLDKNQMKKLKARKELAFRNQLLEYHLYGDVPEKALKFFKDLKFVAPS